MRGRGGAPGVPAQTLAEQSIQFALSPPPPLPHFLPSFKLAIRGSAKTVNMRRLGRWRLVLFGRLGEWCTPLPAAGGCEPPSPQKQKPEATGESVRGHNRCFGGLTCQGGRLEGWRSQDDGGSASSPFAEASKLRQDTGVGVGGGWVRRSLRSRHLLVVPKSLASVLSELLVVHGVEGQRSPPEP